MAFAGTTPRDRPFGGLARWDPFFDPFLEVRGQNDAFYRCYLGGFGQEGSKKGPKMTPFWTPLEFANREIISDWPKTAPRGVRSSVKSTL